MAKIKGQSKKGAGRPRGGNGSNIGTTSKSGTPAMEKTEKGTRKSGGKK